MWGLSEGSAALNVVRLPERLCFFSESNLGLVEEIFWCVSQWMRLLSDAQRDYPRCTGITHTLPDGVAA